MVKKVLKIMAIIIVIFFLMTISALGGFYVGKNQNINISKTEEVISTEIQEEKEEDKIKTLTISAIGDCTIGWATNYTKKYRFDKYLEDNNGNYGYYFEKVKDIFEKDDVTIANLEGTFTEYNVKTPKEFNFSAPEGYKNVLKLGNVDIVSFANNHTHDYGEIGYKDTIKALESIDMPYYGYEKYLIKEINDIKVGFFALLDIDCENYKDIDKAIEYLKNEKCDLIIASMHWGIEARYKQNNAQIKMGHYLIDNGVDLVLGSHPHMLQEIEKYNNKYIIYSLANFCFGGNMNPDDKDTMIFQQTFTFENKEIKKDDNIKIIPASVSGIKSANNYQPIVLEGKEGDRVLKKILKYSTGFNYTN